MNKNLFNLLCKLSKVEWDEFGDFIASPYFVKGRDYSGLFGFLRSHFRKKDISSDISNDLILKKVKNIQSSQTLDNRLSELYKLAQKFLKQKNFESNRINGLSMLYEEFVNRGLFSNFSSGFSANKDISVPKSTADFIPYSKIIQSEGFLYRHNNDFKKTYSLFCEQGDCLTAFYIDRLLYFATEFHFADIYGIQYEANNIKKIINSIDFHSFFKLVIPDEKGYYRTALLRYHVYNSIINPDNHKLIDTAIDYFYKNKVHISLDAKIDYFQKMQSNFIIHINKGEQAFLKILFDLMKVRLDDGETINFSLIDYPASEFRDMVVIGLKVEEFEWVENFIKNYSGILPTAFREEEKTLALLKYYYAKKDFLKVLLIIKKHKHSKKHVHNMDMYKYNLMTNYELQYFDDIESITVNLKNYMRKGEIVEIQKKNTLTFIKLLFRLIRLKLHTSEETSEQFISSVNKETNSLIDKRWFLEKAAEL